MNYSIPGKTFLLGEYIALQGGPCLIFCNEPSFRLSMKESPTFKLQGVSPDSPAGQLIQDNISWFKNKGLSFYDPYAGRGGLGASTAQFLGAYRCLQQLKKTGWKQEDLLKSYWSYAFKDSGIRPSGADLIAQSVGGLCIYHRNDNQLASFNWPFTSLSLLLIKTNHKLKTHEHLATLRKDTEFSQLEQPAEDGIKAIKQNDAHGFIAAIRLYQRLLEQINLSTVNTMNLVKTFSKNPVVLAAKGCGAMGADIILLITEKKNKPILIKQLESLTYRVIADETQLAGKLTTAI